MNLNFIDPHGNLLLQECLFQTPADLPIPGQICILNANLDRISSFLSAPSSTPMPQYHWMIIASVEQWPTQTNGVAGKVVIRGLPILGEEERVRLVEETGDESAGGMIPFPSMMERGKVWPEWEERKIQSDGVLVCGKAWLSPVISTITLDYTLGWFSLHSRRSYDPTNLHYRTTTPIQLPIFPLLLLCISTLYSHRYLIPSPSPSPPHSPWEIIPLATTADATTPEPEESTLARMSGSEALEEGKAYFDFDGGTLKGRSLGKRREVRVGDVKGEEEGKAVAWWKCVEVEARADVDGYGKEENGDVEEEIGDEEEKSVDVGGRPYFGADSLQSCIIL